MNHTHYELTSVTSAISRGQHRKGVTQKSKTSIRRLNLDLRPLTLMPMYIFDQNKDPHFPK